MAFVQKTWSNRITEYPTRRILTDANGNTSTVTVQRAEGEISQEGDAFSAANMNDLENRIANASIKVTTGTAYVSSFESDDTYADYPYRGTITLADESIEITKDTYTELRVAEGQSQDTGILRDIVNTFDGGIYVWASEMPTFDILFSNIKVF